MYTGVEVRPTLSLFPLLSCMHGQREVLRDTVNGPAIADAVCVFKNTHVAIASRYWHLRTTHFRAI